MAYRTRQREAILRLVTSSERPLTAREICRQAGEFVHGIGMATVYRALRQMVEEGQVRHIQIPGVQPHYESSARSHHHFFLCERCNHLTDLTGCLRGLHNLLPRGYRMKRHEIVIYGDCEDCVKAESNGSTPNKAA